MNNKKRFNMPEMKENVQPDTSDIYTLTEQEQRGFEEQVQLPDESTDTANNLRLSLFQLVNQTIIETNRIREEEGLTQR